MIEIIVSPGAGASHRFVAEIEGRVVALSSTPLLAACRALLKGHPEMAGHEVVMHHKGSDHIALRSTVGAAAKLKVRDGRSGRPRFTSWQPFGEV